jgi:hypothetical protein
MYKHFARTYIALLECFTPNRNRRREAQEELLADLNSCIEQLADRTLEMETRIERCTEQATFHARLAQRAGVNSAVRTREQQRAKMHLRDRQRIQAEHEKALRMTHMLESHIDGIVASHVDTLIVQTMRSYNHTARRLAMPALTSQVEHLSEALSDRNQELFDLQEALNGVATAASSADLNPNLSDDALMLELDALLAEPAPPAAPPNRAPPHPQEQPESQQHQQMETHDIHNAHDHRVAEEEDADETQVGAAVASDPHYEKRRLVA